MVLLIVRGRVLAIVVVALVCFELWGIYSKSCHVTLIRFEFLESLIEKFISARGNLSGSFGSTVTLD